MLLGDGHSFQVDVWAVGILLFAMLIGKPPFETTNMKMTYNRIQSCMYVFPPEKPISLNAKVLIQKILTKQPIKRPTLEEVIESDFFTVKDDSDTTDPASSHTKSGKIEPPNPIFRSPREIQNRQIFKRVESYGNLRPGDKTGGFRKNYNEGKMKFGVSEPLKGDDTRKNKAEENSNETEKVKKRSDSKTQKIGADGKPTKEFEPTILKRLINHISNENGEGEESHEEYLINSQSKINPPAESLSRTTPIKNPSSLSNHQTGPESRENAYDMSAPRPQPTRKDSLVLTPQNMGTSNMGASSMSIDPDGLKNKKAFNLIKNNSRMNSMANSMIAQEDESPRHRLTQGSMAEPAGRREKRQEEVDRARDTSTSSVTSNHKKMFFQRMISREINETQNSQIIDRGKKPQKAEAEKTGPFKVRANSLRESDDDNRLSNNLARQYGANKNGNTTTSNNLTRNQAKGSNSTKKQDSNPTDGSNHADTPQKHSTSDPHNSYHRSNSAQADMKVRPNWQTKQADSSTMQNKSGNNPELQDNIVTDYIKKWIDHSNKKFIYLKKNATKKREEAKIYAIKYPPKELEKKTHIMKEIGTSLEVHSQELNLKVNVQLEALTEKIYVKNWVKAKQVTVFKLSNTVYQAVFQDKSEMLMSSKQNSILYINKDRIKQWFNISSPEIQKNRSVHARIEYFKKVLKKWIERDNNTTHVSKMNHELDV